MTSKLSRLGNAEMQSAYDAGRMSRSNHQPKCANPYFYATNLWSCWLGGWNDCDMAIEQKDRSN